MPWASLLVLAVATLAGPSFAGVAVARAAVTRSAVAGPAAPPRAGDPSARDLPRRGADELEAARQKLEEETPDPNPANYLRPVQILMDKGEVQYLAGLFARPANVAVQSEILRHFAAYHRTELLDSALAALGSNQSLSAMAEIYVTTLAQAEPSRAELERKLIELLRDPDSSAELWAAAARASDLCRDLALFPALVDALELARERREANAVQSLLHSLRFLTAHDFGTDTVAWREWGATIGTRTREQLLEEQIQAKDQRISDLEHALDDELISQLRRGTAEDCLQMLENRSERVRIAALEQWLQLKSGATATPTSEPEKKVQQRLEALFADSTGLAKVSRNEIGKLASVYAVQWSGQETGLRGLLRWFDGPSTPRDVRFVLLDALERVVPKDSSEAPGPAVASLLDQLARSVGSFFTGALPEERVRVADALGRVGDRGSWEMLRAELAPQKGESSEVRRRLVQVASLLARKGKGDLLPQTRDCILLVRDDADNEVRLAAAEQISKLVDELSTAPAAGRTEVFQALREVLESSRLSASSSESEVGTLQYLVRAVTRIPEMQAEGFDLLVTLLPTAEPGDERMGLMLLSQLPQILEKSAITPEQRLSLVPKFVALLPPGGRDAAKDSSELSKKAMDQLDGMRNRWRTGQQGSEIRLAEQLYAAAKQQGREAWSAEFGIEYAKLLEGTEPDRARSLRYECAQALRRTLQRSDLNTAARTAILGFWVDVVVSLDEDFAAGRTIEGVSRIELLTPLLAEALPALGNGRSEDDSKALRAKLAGPIDRLADLLPASDPMRVECFVRAASLQRGTGDLEAARRRLEGLVGKDGRGALLRPVDPGFVARILDLAEVLADLGGTDAAGKLLASLERSGTGDPALEASERERLEGLRRRLEGGTGSGGRP